MISLSTASDSNRFTQAAHRAPRFDRDEELELARRWKDLGDRSAANALAHSHFRHVVALARKYRGYGVPMRDLVAEGNFGLVRALDRFDPDRGVRFEIYANYWVRSAMFEYVMKSWSAVSDSAGPLRSSTFFALRRERVRVRNEFGEGEAADRALAARLGVPLTKLHSMLQRLDNRDVSLDASSWPGAPSLADRLATNDDQERRLAQCEIDAGLHEAIDRALAVLDVRERFIVEKRLMADPAAELSVSDVGRIFGVSRQRAFQLEARAKSKLRAHIAAVQNSALNSWISEQVPSSNLTRPGVRKKRARSSGSPGPSGQSSIANSSLG